MTLYEIDEQIKSCFTVDEKTGECLIDEKRLQDLQVERDTKIENIALYIKNLKAEEPAIDAEIKRLQAMKKVNEKKIGSLKEYLKSSLGGQKFKTIKASVSFRSVTAVTLTDAKRIPEQFKRYQEPTVDKAAIKKVLAGGEDVEGASLSYSTSVIVR